MNNKEATDASFVERRWKTKHGHHAIVLMNDMGFRCGYVAVEPPHPLHSHSYHDPSPYLSAPVDEQLGKRGIMPLFCTQSDDAMRAPDVVFDVHGSLTYSAPCDGGMICHDGPENLWWFGFDAGHCDDAPAPGSRMDHFATHGVHRTEEYMVAECESLSEQLVTRVGPLLQLEHKDGTPPT